MTELEILKQQLAQEQAARLEVEAMAEKATLELLENQRALDLLQSVTMAGNQATTIQEAMQIAVDLIADFSQWQVGHAYILATDGSVDLVPLDSWYLANPELYQNLQRDLMMGRIPAGVGLAGRAFSTAKFITIRDLSCELTIPHARDYAALGLKSGLAFPLMIGLGVVGVMEFFAEEPIDLDDKLKKILQQIATQLGRVIERQQAGSALQRSETYFRKLTENALDLITILNADGTIRYESNSIEQVLGFPPDEYNGKNAFEFVHPEDVAVVAKAFQEALQRNGNTDKMVFRFRHKNGSYRILEGVGINLLSDPDVEGIIFNSRDVTDSKKLEEQFLQAQKVQAIGQLAAGVAHDFNNILTAILGYSDLMLMKMAAEDPHHSHVSGIKQAAFRAAALTRQLLAFGRKQVLQPLVINLNSNIAEMEKMLRRLLGADVALVTNPSPDLGRVKADPSQIEQVILNLSVNARDAMVKGGRLTIETANVELDEEYARNRDEVTAGSYVMLAVSDNGSGMTEEVRKRLFEPFFTTKEIGKGTGLGLATCHGIIKQSGGHIAVYSELGVGTTFKVYLPRVDAVESEATESAPQKTIPRGKETVLLVEDEPMLRELGVTYLTELGYVVLTANNGRQALNLVHAAPGRKIDILVSDMVMPEMGGKDLADFMRGVHPDAKILFCSGYTEEAVNIRGTMGPGSSFMPKPFTVETLAVKVRELLDAGKN